MYRDERKLEKMEKVAKSSIGNPNPAHGGGACQVGSATAIAAGAPNFRLERTSVSLISADPLSTASNGAGAGQACVSIVLGKCIDPGKFCGSTSLPCSSLFDRGSGLSCLSTPSEPGCEWFPAH